MLTINRVFFSKSYRRTSFARSKLSKPTEKSKGLIALKNCLKKSELRLNQLKKLVKI